MRPARAPRAPIPLASCAAPGAWPGRLGLCALMAVLAVPGGATGQAAKPAKGTSAATCVNSQCHPNLLKPPSRHAAVRKLRCSVCHPSVKDLSDLRTFSERGKAAWAGGSPHRARPQSPAADKPDKGKDTSKRGGPLWKPPQVPWKAPTPDVNPHDHYAMAYCSTCHTPHGSERPFMLREEPNQLCVTCHTQTGRDQARAHAPVEMGACLICHVPHDPEFDPLLREAQPALCFNCHDDIEASLVGKRVHPPVKEKCTLCHGAHGGNVEKLLPAAGNDLCLGCHSSIRARIEASEVPHKAMEKGCGFCHEPHASANKALLRHRRDAVCRTCHADQVKQMDGMAFPHGAVTASGCLGCHDAHGSKFGALLKSAFPARQPYRNYKEAEYALCFGCHLTKMVDPGMNPPFTRFRDGEKNLHIVHVRRETKGRSCGLCHSAHGGQQPHILHTGMPFGEVKLPYRFKQLGGGGTCQVACHGNRPYGGRATAAAIEKAKADRKKERDEQLRKAAAQRAAAAKKAAGK